MSRKILAAICLCALLSCSGGTSEDPGPKIDAPFALNSGSTIRLGRKSFYSGYATPRTDGTLRDARPGYTEAVLTSSDTGNSVVYGIQIDVTGNNLFSAVSGIPAANSVTAPPTTNTALLSGDFEVGGFDTSDALSNATATPFFDRGTLSVVADFDNGTLTGSGLSSAGGASTAGRELTIDARFVNGQITGDMAYDGEDGAVIGIIGSNEALGAFNGKGFSINYAGGFIVD